MDMMDKGSEEPISPWKGQGQGGSSEVIKIWTVPETVLLIETLGNLKREEKRSRDGYGVLSPSAGRVGCNQLRSEGSMRKSWALRNYAWCQTWVETKSQTVAHVLWLVPGIYI